MAPQAATNLWDGIKTGIQLFENDHQAEKENRRVPALMILTDGLPNHMCPAQGYVTKLKSKKFKPSLHTFGFGYDIRSGLLKGIAEVGGGNYSFIPDAGMIVSTTG